MLWKACVFLHFMTLISKPFLACRTFVFLFYYRPFHLRDDDILLLCTITYHSVWLFTILCSFFSQIIYSYSFVFVQNWPKYYIQKHFSAKKPIFLNISGFTWIQKKDTRITLLSTDRFLSLKTPFDCIMSRNSNFVLNFHVVCIKRLYL